MRPKFNNIFLIYLPVTALCSILHRISGVFMALSTPILLFYLSKSTSSIETFNYWFVLQPGFSGQKLFNVLIILAFTIHILAGVRHLITDFFHIGDSLETGRKTAQLVLLVFSIFAFYIITNYLF